mmetsp:Transcript_86924/g.153936  ORF Transcript_86924/g.153936 Transcript_86924/m.153936 type:complete len:328 (-) Transcript_86924:1593-2576(-)
MKVTFCCLLALEPCFDARHSRPCGRWWAGNCCSSKCDSEGQPVGPTLHNRGDNDGSLMLTPRRARCESRHCDLTNGGRLAARALAGHRPSSCCDPRHPRLSQIAGGASRRGHRADHRARAQGRCVETLAEACCLASQNCACGRILAHPSRLHSSLAAFRAHAPCLSASRHPAALTLVFHPWSPFLLSCACDPCADLLHPYRSLSRPRFSKNLCLRLLPVPHPRAESVSRWQLSPALHFASILSLGHGLIWSLQRQVSVALDWTSPAALRKEIPVHSFSPCWRSRDLALGELRKLPHVCPFAPSRPETISFSGCSASRREMLQASSNR